MKKLFTLIIILSIVSITNAQYQHDSIKTASGFIHYYTKGKGIPIIHLQGGPGFSSYYMRAIADSLAGYQNILIDYDGTGKSQYKKLDTSWVNIESVVNNIEAVRKKLNLKKCILIGHSYGTHFALYYNIKYPDKVAKTILVACIGTNNKFQKYFSAAVELRLGEDDKQALNKAGMDSTMNDAERDMAMQAILLKGYFYDRSKIAKFLASFPSTEMPTLFNAMFFATYTSSHAFWQFDMAKQAYQLTNPIRIIEGRLDPGIDGEQALLNERLKNSKIYYVEESGHFAWIEQPVNFFKTLKLAITE